MMGQYWDTSNHPGRFRLMEFETYEYYDNTFYYIENSSGSVNLDDGQNWSGYHYPYRRKSLYWGSKVTVMDKLIQVGEPKLANYLTVLVDSLIIKNDGLDWGGNCHGYTASSMNYTEPQERIIDGVLFTQPEIKSLMNYYYDDIMGGLITDIIGSRCKSVSQLSYTESILNQIYNVELCRGMNPASLHISLKRLVGNHREPFGMDMDNSDHVWNVPVVGYTSRTLDYHNDNIYHIKTEIIYLDYQTPDEDTDTMGRSGQKFGKMIIEYTLHIDDNGKIIGGDWISNKYPDFIWRHPKKFPIPSGKWEFLNRLID